MLCAPCWRRNRARRSQQPALESDIWLIDRITESSVCEVGEEHSEGVWVSHDGQATTVQTPRQRECLQSCRTATRPALLESPAVQCAATAPPPSALLFTKDADSPTAVERRRRTDQEDEISRHGPAAKSSRSGFTCSSCGREQPSRLHLNAAASGEFVRTPGLPPLVKVTVLLYDSRLVPEQVAKEPDVHSIRLDDHNPFPGSKLLVRVRLPRDNFIRMRHHEDEHGNNLLPVVQYFNTFSLMSCLRCLEKDQSPPLIRHWLLEPLPDYDPADRVHLALDFSYIRAANPPSGFSEKETVDNATTFLLTVKNKRDGGCAEDRSGWRNRLQSLSIAQLLEVARALDIAERDLRSIRLRKSQNEDLRKDLVEMCMTHGSTHTGVFITALAKLDPESSVALTSTCPTQATDYEESASVPVPSAHPELPHPELPEGEGEDSCTAPKKGMGSASEDGQDFVREHTLQNGTFSKSGYDSDAVWFPRSGEYHRAEFVTLHNSEAVPDLASGGAFCADKSSVSDYPFSHSGNSRSQSGECSATMQNSLPSCVQETHMGDILNCDLDGTSLGRKVTQTGMCFSTMDAESMRSSSMNYSTDDGVSYLPKRRKAHDASVEWTCRVAKDPVEHELMHEDSVGCIVADSLDRQSRKQSPESPADLCHISSTTARGQPSVKELSVTGNPRSGRFCNSPPPSAGRATKASADPSNQSPAATHYGNQQKESLLIACQTATKASEFSRAELGTSNGDYGIPCATSGRAPLGTTPGRSNAVPRRKGQFCFSAFNARQNLAGDITVGTTASWTPRNPPPNLRRVHVSEDEESNPKRKYRPPDSAAAAASVATQRSPASSLSQTSSLSRPGPCPQSDHLDGDDSLTSRSRSFPEQEDRSAIRESRGESVASAERSMAFSYISSSFDSSGSGLSTARFSVANPSTVTDADVPASVDVALAGSYLQLLRQGGADTRFNNLASDGGSNHASVSSSVRLDFALSLGSQVSSSSSFSSFLSSSLSPPPSAVVDCRSPRSVGFVRPAILCLQKDASVPAENQTAVDRETSVTQTQTQTNPQEAGTPPPIVSRHWQGSRVITSTGYSWRQPGSDVILHVPAGAVERERPVRVHVAICADVDHIRRMLMLQEEEEEEEKIVSPLAEYCLEGAPNFHFPSPVRLTLPHALPKDVDVDKVHVHRVSRGQDGSVVVTRLRNSAGTSPAAAGGSDAAADDGGGDNDGQGHQAEFPCFHLTSNGELHVVTDCFSGYVCSYNNCGLRQESPVLVAMVCGSYMREGRNQRVIIRTHVWDERLNIRDFQKENRIDASDQILPKEVLPLLDEVHNSKLWLRLLWDDKYWTLARHLLCPEVQTIEMRQVISCNNDNCHARKLCSRPVSISWALLTPADCPPEVTRTLLCSVLVAHAPVDAPPSWGSQDGNIKRLLFSIGDTAILSPPDHRARQVGTMEHHWDGLYSLRQGKAVADWLDGVMTSGDALTSPSERCPDTAGLPPGVANRDDDDDNDDDSVTSNGQSPRSSAHTTKSTDPVVGRGRSYNNNKLYAPSVLGSSGHCESSLRGSCCNACTALRSSASGGTASEAGTATSGVLDPNSIYNRTQLTKTTIKRQFEAELIVADNDDAAGAPRGFSTNGSCCVDGTEAESWQPRSGGRGNQNTRQSSSASEHGPDQLRDPEPLHGLDPRHDLDQRSGLDQRPDPDPRRDLGQLRDPLSQLGSPAVTEDSAAACPEDGRAAGSGRRGNGGKVKRSFASRRRRPKSDKTEQKCTIL